MFGRKKQDANKTPLSPQAETEKDAMNVFSMFRDMLDYNNDELINIKDLQDASQDLEDAIKKQLEFVKKQVEDAQNAGK